MKLSFLWWNTSLSPIGKQDRATEVQKRYAQSLINVFTQEIEADLIALGEITRDDITDIRKKCNVHGYELFDGYSKAGKSYFDTCVLFKNDKFELRNTSNVTAKKGNRTFKIAQRLDFAIPYHNIPLHVFVSHWPSRMHTQQGHPDRAFLGFKLRSEVEELFSVYQNSAAVVLLGDYNDEPFDHSLSEHLMATRDRCLAQKKSSLLYNPFWRKIGHESPYTHDADTIISDGGTHFYKSDDVSRWRTFDQIIFSASFLGSSEWHLNENNTLVLNIPKYNDLVLDSKEFFDHFPVMCVIERIAKNGGF